PVRQFSLRSETGVEVDIIEFGVAVRDWRVPVDGALRSVVLGFDRIEDYVAHSPHFGSLAGRVANRIAGASFDIDGVTYKTEANWSGHTLHGGSGGLGRVVWSGRADDAMNSVSFTFHSPDGDMGFPGNVDFTAVYTLKGNRLTLELSAITDEVTPISLVQHQYFNLGTGPDVLDHSYQIHSSAHTEPGEMLIPTGAILPSKGTAYDFRTPRTMRSGGQPVDYDLNLVLDNGRDTAVPVATVKGPDGKLTLKLWTDRPGLQVYNSVTTDMPVPGLGGKTYGRHCGFCLEDQNFPDAVHNPHFPSIWHGPGKPYSHWCAFEIA
ncbi:MAG: galactose mutarotase, partial [Hyphomicrobiales bacterium]